jgi:phosphoglycerate dehydrogenase-like enzyme
MKILFNLPPSTIARCFRKTDLDRLAGAHEVMLPPSIAAGAFAELAASGKVSGKNPEIAALEAFTAERIGAAEVMVTGWGTPPISPESLGLAPKLKLIIHSAGSIKTLVPEEAWKRGICVGTCNGALAIGVAETTLGMILAGLKGFFPGRDWTRAGNWHDPKLGTARDVLREPFGVTVGVISASKVGQHVLKLLRAFELEVLLYDPFMKPERARELGATLVGLEELMKRSDVVTLHAPALPATRHLLKREHFRAMKEGAVFINTARGMIVDEVGMIEELKTGRISAFIDVTDPEPPTKDSPLRTLQNVVLTPHLAGHASNGCFRQGRSAVDQVLEFAAGKPMHGEVTLAMFATMG